MREILRLEIMDKYEEGEVGMRIRLEKDSVIQEAGAGSKSHRRSNTERDYDMNNRAGLWRRVPMHGFPGEWNSWKVVSKIL